MLPTTIGVLHAMEQSLLRFFMTKSGIVIQNNKKQRVTNAMERCSRGKAKRMKRSFLDVNILATKNTNVNLRVHVKSKRN